MGNPSNTNVWRKWDWWSLLQLNSSSTPNSIITHNYQIRVSTRACLCLKLHSLFQVKIGEHKGRSIPPSHYPCSPSHAKKMIPWDSAENTISPEGNKNDPNTKNLNGYIPDISQFVNHFCQLNWLLKHYSAIPRLNQFAFCQGQLSPRHMVTDFKVNRDWRLVLALQPSPLTSVLKPRAPRDTHSLSMIAFLPFTGGKGSLCSTRSSCLFPPPYQLSGLKYILSNSLQTFLGLRVFNSLCVSTPGPLTSFSTYDRH